MTTFTTEQEFIDYLNSDQVTIGEWSFPYEIGRYGKGVSHVEANIQRAHARKMEEQNIAVNTHLPCNIVFNFNVNNGVFPETDFQRLFGNCYKIINTPSRLISKTIKPEFKEISEEINKRNKELCKNYESDLKVLYKKYNIDMDLSDYFSEIPYPIMEKELDDSHYDFEKSKEYSTVTINCQEGTKIYSVLTVAGLLHKYYPSWYAYGKY